MTKTADILNRLSLPLKQETQGSISGPGKQE